MLDVFLFRLRPSTFCLSQGEDLKSCGVPGCDLLENPDDLSDCEPEIRTDVPAACCD